jgi:hypothetical protein
MRHSFPTRRSSDYLADELPNIPLRDSDDLSLKRKKRYFDTDISGVATLHVTPTFLGSFEGYASVHILTKDLNRIATLPREAHWQAFCSSFGISKRRCAVWQESAIVRHLDRVVGWTARPFQLLDIRSRRLDAVDEIEDAMQALRAFAKAEEPEKKQLQLRRLLATAYPLELSQTLIALVGEDSVTRRIQFTTNPKGNGAETSKAMFKMLDGKRIVRGPKTPPPARYDTTQDTEAKFNPANISFAGIKPVVRKLALFRSEDMDSTDGRTELAVRLYATRLDEAEDLNIYVRVEQIGKVQLAKLKLAEDVISVPIADAAFDFEAGTSNYLVRLTGPNAAIQSLLLSQAVELGGSFRATFGVSTNGVLWSDENHIEFRMENGKLLPLQ